MEWALLEILQICALLLPAPFFGKVAPPPWMLNPTDDRARRELVVLCIYGYVRTNMEVPQCVSKVRTRKQFEI